MEIDHELPPITPASAVCFCAKIISSVNFTCALQSERIHAYPLWGVTSDCPGRAFSTCSFAFRRLNLLQRCYTLGPPRTMRGHPASSDGWTPSRTVVPALRFGRGARPPQTTGMLGHALPPPESFGPTAGRGCLQVVGSRHPLRLPPSCRL